MITYQILNENILVFFNGETFYIGKEDSRYEKVIKNLDNLIPEYILPNANLPKGFRLENNVLYYYKFQIPAKIEKHFTSGQTNFINFWANISSRFNEEEVFLIIKELEKGNLYPISEDGFILKFVFNSETEKIKKILTKDESFVLFNDYYDERLISEYFSFQKEFYKKKTFMESLKSIIKEGFSHIYIKNISLILKNATIDDTVFCLKENHLKIHREILETNLSNMFSIFLKNKSNTFQKERFLNLINNHRFLDMIAMFNYCENESLNFDFENCSVEQAYFLIEREFIRIKKVGRNLGILKNFKYLSTLNNKIISKNYSLVVPKSEKDLVLWGMKIGNCVGNGSYADICFSKTGYILGLFDNEKNEILATIEVRSKDNNDLVCQFEGILNGKSKQHVSKKDALWEIVQKEINNAKKTKVL